MRRKVKKLDSPADMFFGAGSSHHHRDLFRKIYCPTSKNSCVALKNYHCHDIFTKILTISPALNGKINLKWKLYFLTKAPSKRRQGSRQEDTDM